MGLCASTSDTQTDSSTPAVSKRTVKTSTVKTSTVASKPAPKKRSKKTRKSQTVITPKQSGGNKILNDSEDDNREKLSAREAARLAAEKRLQDSNDKSTRGELGRKLAEERSKSHKSQLMKQAEQQRLNKANDSLNND
ncbi:hypothetical protein HG535_0B01550 [Zygotorulaspora mrakii]|uniref:Uncharacterized protein n=1 Tax=Zygotorulaspora mrakii TaxID=42260 RepID=A0A7H9AY66_ZYGMR|nr:uncharacterized protein HG535_0B01550 [Zygotorulaspora mrakii]QLG71117.1 hypothetical protein HG535_0B01550 [Zygotorulaspora mrakii]